MNSVSAIPVRDKRTQHKTVIKRKEGCCLKRLILVILNKVKDLYWFANTDSFPDESGSE